MAGRLLAFDYATRQPQVLAEGFGQGDGVYFVGEWPERLFRVTADGRVTILIDSRKSTNYINENM